MNNYIFDSHCHIQNSSIDDSDRNTIRNEICMPKEYTLAVVNKIKTLPVKSVGMMGTSIYDSLRMADIIEVLQKDYSPVTVYYGFGIHPWLCENTEKSHPDWKEQLENLLIKHPKACIGECGLDKVARNRATKKPFSMPKQMEFFEFQFYLAAKYKRSIVIHSVKTVGKLFEFIKKQLTISIDHIPPKIMFHSYCGSPDITKSLLNLSSIRSRLYFGFSYAVNSRIQHNEENFKLIPQDRILIETDFHEIDDIPEYLEKLYDMLRGYTVLQSVEDLYKLTYENAKDFFTF